MSVTPPWSDIEIPENVRAVPAQLAREEKQYLIWLAESAFTEKAALIELGTLLGGSSVALGEGLRRRGSRSKIIAMDRFSWWGDEFRPPGVSDGDDFMAHYEANVREYAGSLDARRADLSEVTYDEGPIEILFVDAAKDWKLLNATLRTFGPHLIPGESRVVFQDFRYLAYWIQLVIDSRPDLWEQVEETGGGCTVTFRPRSTETLSWCANAAFGDDDFPWETAQKSFERRIAAASPVAADQYRFAAMVKAIVELEIGAVAEIGAQVPESDRRGNGFQRAAGRGAELLRERLVGGSANWRESLEGRVDMTRLKDEIAALPAQFHPRLNALLESNVWHRQ